MWWWNSRRTTTFLVYCLLIGCCCCCCKFSCCVVVIILSSSSIYNLPTHVKTSGGGLGQCCCCLVACYYYSHCPSREDVVYSRGIGRSSPTPCAWPSSSSLSLVLRILYDVRYGAAFRYGCSMRTRVWYGILYALCSD